MLQGRLEKHNKGYKWIVYDLDREKITAQGFAGTKKRACALINSHIPPAKASGIYYGIPEDWQTLEPLTQEQRKAIDELLAANEYREDGTGRLIVRVTDVDEWLNNNTRNNA